MAAVALAATALLLSACQPSAALTWTRGPLVNPVEANFRSEVAYFDVGPTGRQTIVLAFDPVPAQPTADGSATTFSPYRRYVQIAVQKGGGNFKVRELTASGNVFAHYYFYEGGVRTAARLAQSGSIVTKVWPFNGSLDPDEWRTTGTFDLRLDGDARIEGEFDARYDPERVKKFLKERRL
jgi:hypothetical protein